MKIIRGTLALICLFGICRSLNAGSQPRMSKKEVIAVAKRAISARFPWAVNRYHYDAFILEDGIWGVYVPHPGQPDLMGGGEPNAEVRDRDGKVLKVYLAR